MNYSFFLQLSSLLVMISFGQAVLGPLGTRLSSVSI